MKKILLALVVIFVLAGSALVGLLVLANRVTNYAHRDFFELVASNDPDRFLGQCDEALKGEMDRPVLTAWMQELNSSLGSFQNTSTNGFRYEVSLENGVRIARASGVAVFSRGTAHTELNYVDEKLVGFRVDSDQLADGWFSGPADTSLYRRKTREFFEHFVAGTVDQASEMMHESLRASVSEDSLGKMIETVTQWSGPTRNVKCIDNCFRNQDGEILTITAVIEGESATLEATTEFQFIGLKGHLVAFNVSRPDSTDHAPADGSFE